MNCYSNFIEKESKRVHSPKVTQMVNGSPMTRSPDFLVITLMLFSTKGFCTIKIKSLIIYTFAQVTIVWLHLELYNFSTSWKWIFFHFSSSIFLAKEPLGALYKTNLGQIFLKRIRNIGAYQSRLEILYSGWWFSC